ncbi:MAG: response regulator [Methanomassiliicoccales archaeon]|nr:response regulator [Methanomassiliicoccales archaeon]
MKGPFNRNLVVTQLLYGTLAILSTGKMKVLVVDDDERIRELLRDMLSGHEVVEAESGAKAIESFRRERPDLVLMDIVMRGMDGIEATRRILSENPNAAVLAVTGFSASQGEAIIEAGAREVIAKPLKRSDLLSTIRKYSGGRMSQGPSRHPA